MNPSRSPAFVNHLVVYALVMICFSGGVGLGTVWLRHQISVSANRSRRIEDQIAEIERHWAEQKSEIEVEQGPEMLKRRNAELQLGLVPPREAQVARVSEDPRALLAAKHNRGLFSETGLQPVIFRPPGK